MLRIIQSLFVSFLIAGCVTKNTQSLPSLDYSARDLQKTERALNPEGSQKEINNYLALDLPFEAFEKLRKSVEAKEGFVLKHRGEAHITMISPPEFQKMQNKLSMKEIRSLADKMNLRQSPYKLVCVGKGILKDSGVLKSTYYAVVEANRLFEIRRAIQMLYLQKGGHAEDFNPDLYYPHVTLGFTDRDLHYEDGVIKDASSCVYSLNAKD
ncbi:MAG: hypothetical protein ACXVCP_00550 [Bdellovibrio sp.]